MKRWKPSGAWQIARLQWPSGPPRKAAEVGIMLTLLERMNPLDGADAAGRIRNADLATRSATAEVRAVLCGLGLEASQVGGVAISLGELADLAGADLAVVRRTIRRARDVRLIFAVPAPGAADLYVWNDAVLLDLDSRAARRTPIENHTPTEYDTPIESHTHTPTGSDSPIESRTPSGSRTPAEVETSTETQGWGVAETPPTPLLKTQGGRAREENARAFGPPGPPGPTPHPIGRGVAEPPVIVHETTPEQYGEIEALWRSGFGHARRGRGVQGFNGAEQPIVTDILARHGFEAVAAAVKAEILRAGQHERGPRLDWVRDALDGKVSPQAGGTPAVSGRRPASPMPARDAWLDPKTRGEK